MKQQPKSDYGVAWHRQINSEVMRRCDDRWVDFRFPENWTMAIVKSLVAIAQLQSHDPIVLQRSIGYPLPFLAALVNNLVRLECWFRDEGYFGLIECLESTDEDALDSKLHSPQGRLISQDSSGVIDIEDVWYQCTGVPPGASA